MKTRLLIMLAIGISGLFLPPAFSVTEELIHGSSSIELLPSEINPGKPTSFEIKFQYTEGPYALDNFIPVIEVSPASAKQYITIDVNPTGVTNRQILRIPATLTVDPQIEHEKIFLSISFSGNHFSSRSDAIYKSDWSESVILNISPEKLSSTELPSSQDYEFETMSGARCDGEISRCYGTFANGTTIPIQCDYPHSCGVISFDDYDVPFPSPLKQIKSGVAIDKIRCNEGLKLIYKNNGIPSCVKSLSILKLAERGWISETDEHSLFALKKVSESCANDSSKERMSNPLRYSNGTHAFLNLGCEWKKIGVYVGDATSSYMNKVIPTLDDFRNTLNESQNIDIIFSKFGDPHDDIGSGIHIYVYELNDDTQIWIGYNDHILYVTNHDLAGNVLEELFVENKN